METETPCDKNVKVLPWQREKNVCLTMAPMNKMFFFKILYMKGKYTNTHCTYTPQTTNEYWSLWRDQYLAIGTQPESEGMDLRSHPQDYVTTQTVIQEMTSKP